MKSEDIIIIIMKLLNYTFINKTETKSIQIQHKYKHKQGVNEQQRASDIQVRIQDIVCC